MKNKLSIFIFLFLVGFISSARADILYLRNGRDIEGLIDNENEEIVVLNVGFGTVKFRRVEIENIVRSTNEEAALIRQEWQRQKKLYEERRLKREKELEKIRRDREFEPKEVEYAQRAEHIVVDTLLNRKVKVSLLLDTGASVILLSSRIAKKRGIKDKLADGQTIKVRMADGRKADATYIVLDSVSVEGLEAKDVGAVILSDDRRKDMQEDGLLGMSFLNKFNFQIDTVNKKLLLQKRR